MGFKAANNIIRRRELIDLDGELRRIDQFGANIVTTDDSEYPALLRQIYAPPLVLYVRGTLRPEDAYAIAMVGTRQSTLYGRQTAERLARQ